MTEEARDKVTINKPTLYHPAKNPFLKTITVCGTRPCWTCMGTANENFAKSRQPSVCRVCKGTRRETYFRTKENPYFGKTEDRIDKSLDSYKYRKEVEQICKNLSEAENLNPNVIKMYQEAIETYEKLGGANPLVTLAKQQLVRLRRTHILLNFNNNLEKYKFEGKLSVEKIDSYQKALNTLEKEEADQVFNLLTKKESSLRRKELEKLRKHLNGVKDMDKLPDIAIIIDQKRELTAIKECRKLGIPVVSILDTNCNPDLVDIPIPGNDDAVRSIKLILKSLSDSINEGKE